MYYELRNIIEGIGESPKGNFIQTALFYLRKSERASGTSEKSEFINKKDEIFVNSKLTIMKVFALNGDFLFA